MIINCLFIKLLLNEVAFSTILPITCFVSFYIIWQKDLVLRYEYAYSCSAVERN